MVQKWTEIPTLTLPPARTMSRPGVWGNDVTGDATGPTSVPCWFSDTSGCSGSEGTTTTDRSDGVGSHSLARSWRLTRGLFHQECPTFFNNSCRRNLRTSGGSTSRLTLRLARCSSAGLCAHGVFRTRSLR